MSLDLFVLSLALLIYINNRFSRATEDYGPLVNYEGVVPGIVLKIIMSAAERAGYIGTDRFKNFKIFKKFMCKAVNNASQKSTDKLARAAFPGKDTDESSLDEYSLKMKRDIIAKRERERLKKQRQREARRVSIVTRFWMKSP